jgi:hypothetical protein
MLTKVFVSAYHFGEQQQSKCIETLNYSYHRFNDLKIMYAKIYFATYFFICGYNFVDNNLNLIRLKSIGIKTF